MKAFRRAIGSKLGMAALTALVTIGVAVPTAVWAAVSFSDVPPTHPFYNDINAVAGAGIANGFPDGSFHPSDPVTRQALAAFSHRAGSRIQGGNDTFEALKPGYSKQVTTATMDAGAVASGAGFVHVSASGRVSLSRQILPLPTGCPCTVEIGLYDSHSHLASTYVTIVSTQVDSNGEQELPWALDRVVSMRGGSSETFRVVATLITGSSTSESVFAHAALVLEYAPFSGQGGDSQAYLPRCPRDDGFEPNDTQGAAAELASNDSETPGVVCPSNEDWFHSPYLLAGQTINVDLSFANAGGDIDACLFSSTGVQLSCSTSKTDFEHLTYTATANYTRVDLKVFLVSESDSVVGNAYRLFSKVR